MEERLGRRMPPSYREFLKVSDGWRHAGGFVWLLAGQVWQCRYLLADSPGRVSAPAVIRWTETGTATMPADHNARAVRTLDGTSAPAPRTLRITEQPVLITL
jgi:hypothetical protein